MLTAINVTPGGAAALVTAGGALLRCDCCLEDTCGFTGTRPTSLTLDAACGGACADATDLPLPNSGTGPGFEAAEGVTLACKGGLPNPPWPWCWMWWSDAIDDGLGGKKWFAVVLGGGAGNEGDDSVVMQISWSPGFNAGCSCRSNGRNIGSWAAVLGSWPGPVGGCDYTVS